MIQEEPLKNLEVHVSNGGSLVSHRVLFTPDSKNLLVVVGNSVWIYSVKTGACTGKIHLPSADEICNIELDPQKDDTMVVCTKTGRLYFYEITTRELKRQSYMNLTPEGWTYTVILSVEHFVYPDPKFFFIVANLEGQTLPGLFCVSNHKEGTPYFLEKIGVKIVRNRHAVACGASGEFVAAIQEHALYVRDYGKNLAKMHMYGERTLTCVAVHPYDRICATGDETGRIILWTNSVEENHPAKTVFHWHTLPLRDLVFTADGSQMHSGGGECTLVKWDVSNTENKRAIPRLGLPIRHISVSSKNSLTAVSQADNSIKIIDVHNKIVKTVQTITRCYIPEDENDSLISESTFGGTKVYQAGLLEDPNRNALVMNGKPGQLQCVSVAGNKNLYDLDITQQNYVTSERCKVIPFSEVTHSSFSMQGTWLATVESRYEARQATEVKLKFWKFDAASRKFVLNTSIDWPHENGVINLKMQQISDDDPFLIAATSGGDKKFKTWGILRDPSIHQKAEWWNCENVGTHRDHPAGPLCFSKDGSLLAASFSRTLTLWSSTTHEFKGALAHQRIPESIKFVDFGSGSTSHLVICCSQYCLAVWDVISFSLLWAIPLEVQSLAVDAFSDNVAVFTSKLSAFFFHATNPEPLAVYHHVSKSEILSSLFVSSACSLPKAREMRSSLVFINASQELCSFVPKYQDEDTNDEPVLSINASNKPIPLTPYAQMIAEKTVSQIPASDSKLKVKTGGVGLLGAQVIQAILESSPHTLPSITFYCEQLLSATTVKVNPRDTFEQVEKLVLESHQKRSELLNEDNIVYEGLKDKVLNSENILVGVDLPVAIVAPPDPDTVAQENTAWIHEIIFS